MAFNLTAAVGIAAGSIGLIAGALIPKPAQRYGMAVVTGTTTPNPAMQEYVQKFDALLSESGCRTIVRQPATLLMEGDGGPLTVVRPALTRPCRTASAFTRALPIRS